MKVQTVNIHFKAGCETTAGFNGVSFSEGQGYPDLHYIVRDGMAVVNWRGRSGERCGHSVPISDIQSVSTVA